ARHSSARQRGLVRVNAAWIIQATPSRAVPLIANATGADAPTNWSATVARRSWIVSIGSPPRSGFVGQTFEPQQLRFRQPLGFDERGHQGLGRAFAVPA